MPLGWNFIARCSKAPCVSCAASPPGLSSPRQSIWASTSVSLLPISRKSTNACACTNRLAALVPLPRSVKNLLEYAGLKLRAERLWIRSIERKKDTLEVQFHAETKVEPAQLMEFIAAHPGAQFTPAGGLRLPLRGDSKDPLPRLEALLAPL